jgi:hypothetical protein
MDWNFWFSIVYKKCHKFLIASQVDIRTQQLEIYCSDFLGLPECNHFSLSFAIFLISFHLSRHYLDSALNPPIVRQLFSFQNLINLGDLN